ncbi:hypothetical protein LP419_29965 [Massilia sp. H-1]|nr:hypothetical protein LP419_29965 [Massilia sp. H-1]
MIVEIQKLGKAPHWAAISRRFDHFPPSQEPPPGRRGGRMLYLKCTAPEQRYMTIVPKEISAAAVKASATEKITPMMQQYLRQSGSMRVLAAFLTARLYGG